MTSNDWLLEGAEKDAQTINARWVPTDRPLIDGVIVREVLNVPKQNGYLTEMYRGEWALGLPVDQIFQVVLRAGAISAWHAHAHAADRLFVASGICRIVLFDSRQDSPTRGLVNDFRFGTIRPATVFIPPRVWHGVMNLGDGPAAILNFPDAAYRYDEPDHWRLPADTPEIPFRF